MPHIFISYAKKDTRELALALADALNTVDGVTAWVDRSLRAGKAWELQIQAEIDRCDVMVVLYSPDINRHKNGEPESYVLREIHYTKVYAKKPIIPIMAQPTDPPFSLIMEQYIDYVGLGLSVADLFNILCAELGVDTTSPRRISVVNILPSPFEWREIPPGKVTLGEGVNEHAHSVGQTFSLPAFSIAKYPITNAQFAKFIEAGGYRQSAWWTEAGWARQRKTKNRKQPYYWTETKWNHPDYPVVGISWYEAVAFCNWLREISGENITLPTEQQWQRAAQGDDGRTYPWGNKWDVQLCNNSVGKDWRTNQTSPVYQYEEIGDSPFNVTDMAGNVWEWCLTSYQTGSHDLIGKDDRVLRGGAWIFLNEVFFRTTCRFKNQPHLWLDNWGFRIVRNY